MTILAAISMLAALYAAYEVVGDARDQYARASHIHMVELAKDMSASAVLLLVCASVLATAVHSLMTTWG